MALNAELAKQLLDAAKNNITGGKTDDSRFVSEAKEIYKEARQPIDDALKNVSGMSSFFRRQPAGTIMDLGGGSQIELLEDFRKGDKGFAQFKITAPNGQEETHVHTGGNLIENVKGKLETAFGMPGALVAGGQSSPFTKVKGLLSEIGSATDVSANEINSLRDTFKSSRQGAGVALSGADRAKDQGFGVFINNGGQPVAARSPEQRDSFASFGFKEASEEEAKNILNGGEVQAAALARKDTGVAPQQANLLLPDDANKKANNNVVDHLYNYYFDRPAKQKELDNWGKKGGADTTVQALEIFLQKEQIDNNYVSEAQRSAGVTEPGVVQNAATGVTGATGATSDTGLPDEIVNSPDFQALDDDMKAIAELMFTSMTAKDAQTAQQAEDALAEATKLVSPFNKIMVAFAVDQIPDQFKTTKSNIQNQLQSSQETLQEIENLKQDATLEEQQTLNSLSRNFEQNINGLQEQMADRGLTFSSKRTDLERFVGQQNADLVQSSRRGFEKRSRDLARSKQQTERQADLTRQAGESQLKGIARGAEAQLGTDRAGGLDLKGLEGQTIAPLGGTGDTPKAGGSIEQQRQQQILNLSQQIQQFNNPQALENLFNQ